MTALKYQVYRIIAHIKDGGPVTVADLAEELDIAHKTALRHLRELWALDLLYICAWDREYRQPIPVYQWGPGKSDVARPTAMTKAESARRRRQRAREELRP